MKNELNEPPINFKSDEPHHDPYRRAKQEWDERIGSARVQAQNWRLFALGAMGLSLVLALGLIYQSSKSTVTPYVVQVNSDGLVQAVGPAQNMNYVPQINEIKYFLAQFVTKSRTLPLDPVVAKQNWVSAYAFMQKAAQTKMNQYMINDKMAERIGNETSKIDVSVIVPLSKNSYQIRWQETVFSSDGQQTANYKMTGLFTIDFIPPTNEKVLLVNPLGLYIKDFSWSKEI